MIGKTGANQGAAQEHGGPHDIEWTKHRDSRTKQLAAALKIVPAQPHVLSNLGLSYALSKKLPQAEKTLQDAAAQHDADKPVRQNLALVLALEGKFASAEEMARRDLDAKDAAANVAAIRRIIAQSNTWKQIQALDSRPKSAAETHLGSIIE